MQTKQVSKVAVANDVFRKMGMSVTVTQGVHALPEVGRLLNAISAYGDFNEGNDPYGEHDFGSLSWFGEKVFWKIDYYNRTLTGWCDPLSDNCRRIITVMLASEY